MKEIIYFLFLLVVVFFGYNHFSSQLGDKYYFHDMGHDSWQTIKYDKIEVVPQTVVEYDSDNRFIIATRIVVELYNCYPKNTKDFNPKNSIASVVHYKHIIEYWLIDKKNKKAYISNNKEKIENKLIQLESKLAFKDKNYNEYTEMTIKDRTELESCIIENAPEKNKFFQEIVRL